MMMLKIHIRWFKSFKPGKQIQATNEQINGTWSTLRNDDSLALCYVAPNERSPTILLTEAEEQGTWNHKIAP